MRKLSKILSFSVFSLSAFWLVGGTAAAHVTVKPSEVKTAERVTFATSVPNEHDTPVVGVRLIIPAGLRSVRPFAKTGWNISITKTGEGENATATEINWTSAGSTVPVDMKDDFLFGAQAPAEPAELKWMAYETYADGTVVAWEQEPSEAEGNKPYSVTKVVTETAAEIEISEIQAVVAEADKSADNALYVSIAALGIGIVGLVMALRGPKNKEE